MSDSAESRVPARSEPASLAARFGLALGAAIISLLLGLTIIEVVLRVTGLGVSPRVRGGDHTTAIAHRRSKTPGLLYELTPGRRVRAPSFDIEVNSDGLRGPEVRPKGTFVRRIAVLGDSTTFGHGVEYRDTYCAVLENLLNEADSHCRYQVLDFGVSGYSTRDEAAVLREKVPRFEPDLVIVGYNLNDPEFTPRQPLNRHFTEEAWWERFGVLRQLERSHYTMKLRLRGGNYFRYLHAEGDAPWRSVTDAFADMAHTAHEMSVPLLLAIFPFGAVPEDVDAYAYSDLHRQIAGAASAVGMEVLDLTPAYADAGGKSSYLLKDNHPNPLGHRIAARALLHRLLADDAALFGHDS